MSTRQIYRFTKQEAINHIMRVLKIKPVSVFADNSFVVRNSNTLTRIAKWASKDMLVGKFSNSDTIVSDRATHQWVDIWVDNGLITARWYKPNKNKK